MKLHEVTSEDSYGTSLTTTLPSGKQVVVATDYYGEVKGKLQVLIHEDKEDDDYTIAIRFDDDGQIVEIAISPRDQRRISIVQHDADTPWHKERDGELKK